MLLPAERAGAPADPRPGRLEPAEADERQRRPRPPPQPARRGDPRERTPRPLLRLADERAQLRQERVRRRTLAIECLDPLESCEHGARLLHGLDASREGVSARAQLCDACGLRAQAEQRLVELAQELRAVAVQEDGDEHPTDEVEGRLAEALDEVGALLRGLAEERRGAHAGGPGAVAVAERGSERVAELLRAKRVVLEERELPAVQRVAEAGVLVGEREQRAELDGDGGAEGVEARRLAGRRGRGDRQHRADAVGPPVEALEEHGAGGDGCGSRETEGSDGVGELARRVRNLARAALERALELEYAEAVGLAAEVAG